MLWIIKTSVLNILQLLYFWENYFFCCSELCCISFKMFELPSFISLGFLFQKYFSFVLSPATFLIVLSYLPRYSYSNLATVYRMAYFPLFLHFDSKFYYSFQEEYNLNVLWMMASHFPFTKHTLPPLPPTMHIHLKTKSIQNISWVKVELPIT